MKYSKHAAKKRVRMPGGKPWEGPEKKGGHGKTILVVLLLLLLLAAVAFLVVKLMDNGLKYEDNVFVGSADNSEERKKELQEMVDKSMITMSINASPVWMLSDEGAGVNWEIENPEGQSTKLIRVEVIRDDTGKKIYETGAIRPGTYVSGTKPDVALDVGVYPCTAYFYSYDIDTEEFLGKAGAQITLYVQP